VGFEIVEQQSRRTLHIPPKTGCRTTLWNSDIVNLLFDLNQIQGFAPLGFSQLYESYQDIEKVFYVEVCWRCAFLFRVVATT